jgi:colanic acid biosynthesis glycosyl transferase WcaI
MRILIHGLNFSPELVGVGKYTGEMAEWLAARGHEVRAVTAPPFNPQWKVAAGFSSWRYCSQSFASGLRVLRCPLWVPSQPAGLNRIVHLASFALSSFPLMLLQSAWRPDIVLVIEPTLFSLPAAWLTAELCGAKTWLHVQDFEADAGFELGMLNSSLLRAVVESVERKCMSAFDRISTISEKMLAKLQNKGVPPAACCLFPNWVDTNAIFPLAHPSPLRAELGISAGDVVALYAGTMARKQGLDLIAEAAARLAGHVDEEERIRENHLRAGGIQENIRKNIRFIFCGDGPGKAALVDRTGALANVQWIPMQSLERLNDLLNLADIHLLPQKADAADLVMPSKLTGMLASGRPVVATARPGTQLAQAVQGRGNDRGSGRGKDRGIVVEPADASAFVGAIEHLAGDPERRQILGQNAREYALAELEKDAVLGRFEQELLALAATDKRRISENETDAISAAHSSRA